MTERTEVRWNLTNTSQSNITFYPTPFQSSTTIFNVGGGSISADYKYTIPYDGTYLVGYSAQSGAQSTTQFQFYLDRGGAVSSIDLVSMIGIGTGGNQFTRRTVSKVILYDFLEGDTIFPAVIGSGRFRYNFTSPTGDDVYNSFWGVRFDY